MKKVKKTRNKIYQIRKNLKKPETRGKIDQIKKSIMK